MTRYGTRVHGHRRWDVRQAEQQPQDPQYNSEEEREVDSRFPSPDCPGSPSLSASMSGSGGGLEAAPTESGGSDHSFQNGGHMPPLFKGERRAFLVWKDNFKRWERQSRVRLNGLTSAEKSEHQFESLLDAFPVRTASRSVVEMATPSILTAARAAPLAPPPGLDGASISTGPTALGPVDYARAYELMWQMLEAKYATPGPDMISDFRNATRSGEPAEMWGARLLGLFAPLQSQISMCEARELFLKQLAPELKAALSHYLNTTSIETLQEIERLVEEASRIEYNMMLRRTYEQPAAPKTGGRPLVADDEHLAQVDLSQRRVRIALEKRCAKDGLVVLAANDPRLRAAGAPARTPPNMPVQQPRKWCEYHQSDLHNTGDCRVLKDLQREQVKRAGAALAATNPRPASAGSQIPNRSGTPPLSAVQPKHCSHCHKLGHIEATCWQLHPELAPPYARMQGAPRAAAAAQHDNSHDLWALQEETAHLRALLSSAQEAAAAAHSPTQDRRVTFADAADHAAACLPDMWGGGHPACAAARLEIPTSFNVLQRSLQHNPAAPAQLTVPTPSGPLQSAGDSMNKGKLRELLTRALRMLDEPAAATDAPEPPLQAGHEHANAPRMPGEHMPMLSHLAPPKPPHTPAPQPACMSFATSVPPQPHPPALPHAPPTRLTPTQLEEYNVANDSLWFMPHDVPASQTLTATTGGANARSLTLRNAMIDPGASVVMASRGFCKDNNLTVQDVPVPLTGAMGGGSAKGYLRTPVNLTLFAGTQHATTVTVGGHDHADNYIPVLISDGTEGLYDLLLGNAFTRRNGGGLDTCTGEFIFRPFLQSDGDRTTTVSMGLRPNPVPRRPGMAALTTRAAHFACAATTRRSPTHNATRVTRPVPNTRRAALQANQTTPTLPTLQYAMLLLLCVPLAHAPALTWPAFPPLALLLLLPLVYIHWRTRLTASHDPSGRGVGPAPRAHTRYPKALLLIVPLCLLGACVATGTVDLMGMARFRQTIDGLGDVGLAAHHIPCPSALVQSTMPTGAQALLDDGNYTVDDEHGWTWGNHPEVSPEQQAQLKEVVVRNKTSFAYSVADLPGYSGEVGPFRLSLTTDEAIVSRPRRYSPIETTVMHEKFADLHEAHIIAPQGPTKYASCPTVAAKKDSDGNWTDKRVCIDSRAINTRTEADRYRTKLPDELFQDIGNSRFFSKIDLRAGFHQIPIAEEDQQKTTFWWGNKLFRFKRLSFGLKNATAHFQRVMDHEIGKSNLTEEVCCFVDDLLIHSPTMESHLTALDKTLKMLNNCGLRAHPEKSVFAASFVEFLGHTVSAYGMSPHEAKVAAIREMPAPTNVSDLRSLLGFCGYYRNYVPNYSAIAQPLNALLSKDVPWEWTPAVERALEELKHELCTDGRALRRAVPGLPFVLYTDWSKQGVGAVLAQLHPDGNEYMVACISRSLNKHEANYSSYEGEALACVWAVKTLRHYLHGIPFQIVTDHQPLTYLMTSQNLTGKHARWALSLQDYEFTTVHRPGVTHANADGPSRLPRGSAFDGTGARLNGHPNDPPAANLSSAPAAPPLIPAAFALARNPATRPAPQTSRSMPAGMLPKGRHAPPHTDDMLKGHSHADEQEHYTDMNPAGKFALGLRAIAASAAMRQFEHAAPPCPLAPATSDAHSLDVTPVDASFFTTAATTGLVLVELCGGICAGLEMLLRNGVIVRQYLYADTDPSARLAAAHRMRTLSMAYPDQLSPDLAAGMFALPQDVRNISAQDLHDAGANARLPLLLVAGWPCQDLSPAGRGGGLAGTRSSLLHDVLRVLTTLQRARDSPTAYILENAAIQHNFKHPGMAVATAANLTGMLGRPICLDAAQFNARAHRLRNYWTNLANPLQVQRAAYAWLRTPGLLVNDILDPGRTSQNAPRTESHPFYTANTTGAPLSALPTLVSFPGSYAYRDGNPGMVWDAHLGRFDEPNADERERALGYHTGATAAPGLTERCRRHLLGNCIDQNLFQCLYALCRSTSQLTPARTPPSLPATHASCGYPLGGGDSTVPARPSQHAAHALSNGQPQDSNRTNDKKDIWCDTNTITFLQNGTLQEGLHPDEARRVLRRSASYLKVGNTILRAFPDGGRREVPHPSSRTQLILETHDNTGHFGEKRTLSLLQTTYWWYGIGEDVARLVSQCELCDRMKASFNSPSSQLNPLPIQGMFYRWGCDLAGPLPETPDGNRYVMISIEHFSKHLVLTPLPSKEARYTALAFRSQVLCKFGACAEVVTDGGGEFDGEFDSLLKDACIDHRTTRANNPQADGLAERAVQTVKRSLRKLVEQSQDSTSWDSQALPWIALGYNASTQGSTGYSPYYLLHGVQPVVPPAVKERMEPPLDLADPSAAQALLERAAAMRQSNVIAAGNLAIAQHRDTLRYATLRSGSYHPRMRKYEVGDYVRARIGEANSTLDTSHYNHILRVAAVKTSGNLVLQGACGRSITTNVINCAPCHLTNIDTEPLPQPARPHASLACEICGFADRDDVMLLCDSCETGWHIDCLTPSLPAVPEGDEPWLCPRCVEQGVNPDTILVPSHPAPEQRRQSLFPSAAAKKRDAAARQLDGCVIRDGDRTGVARFVRAEQRPRYFDIDYEDGEVAHNKTATFVRNRLHPSSTPSAAAAVPTYLPLTWDLRSASGVEGALQLLMPGKWARAHMSRLANEISSTYNKPRDNPLAPTVPREVQALLSFVDFTQLGAVLDPWAGTCTIRKVFAAQGIPVFDNDLNPRSGSHSHKDALQPAFYRYASLRAPIDAVVASPWFTVLDLALPLAVSAARCVACVHVPGHFITDAHPNRSAYLRALMREDKVHVLWNLPKGPSGRRCGWLLVFATPALKHLLLKDKHMVTAPFSFM